MKGLGVGALRTVCIELVRCCSVMIMTSVVSWVANPSAGATVLLGMCITVVTYSLEALVFRRSRTVHISVLGVALDADGGGNECRAVFCACMAPLNMAQRAVNELRQLAGGRKVWVEPDHPDRGLYRGMRIVRLCHSFPVAEWVAILKGLVESDIRNISSALNGRETLNAQCFTVGLCGDPEPLEYHDPYRYEDDKPAHFFFPFHLDAFEVLYNDVLVATIRLAEALHQD